MSEFSTEGHAPFPSLYVDNGLVGEFSDWTEEALNDRIAVYTRFIQDSELPKHKSTARRIIDHAIFEMSYREGIYGR